MALASMGMQTKRSTCFFDKKKEDISTLNGDSLKSEDEFTYLRSNVSSTENDINSEINCD